MWLKKLKYAFLGFWSIADNIKLIQRFSTFWYWHGTRSIDPITFYSIDRPIPIGVPADQKLLVKCNTLWTQGENRLGIVTKIENIKTDATKILRPTGFSWSKNIKTDVFFVGLNLWLFFFQIRWVGLNIYLLFILENKTETLKTDNRVMYTTYIRIMLKTAKC